MNQTASVTARWARIWRGRTHVKHFDDYAAYLHAHGVRKIEGIPGNQGVLMLRQLAENHAVFSVISFWPDLETIKAFAGEDITRTRHLDEDPRYLLELPEYVEHHEIYSA